MVADNMSLGQLAAERRAAAARQAAYVAGAARDNFTVTSAPVVYRPQTYYAAPPAPVPPPPPPPPPPRAEQNIKIATRDLFLASDPVMSEEDIFFNNYEQISGMKMLELARTGSVNGIEQKYLAIPGLADINMTYDPARIIALQNTDDDYFNQFPIILNNYVPSVGTGPNGEIVYVDSNPDSSTYNSLIINVVNLRSSERVEIEFLTFDSLLNDTIIET